jgi:hypothetical protein
MKRNETEVPKNKNFKPQVPNMSLTLNFIPFYLLFSFLKIKKLTNNSNTTFLKVSNSVFTFTSYHNIV